MMNSVGQLPSYTVLQDTRNATRIMGLHICLSLTYKSLLFQGYIASYPHLG